MPKPGVSASADRSTPTAIYGRRPPWPRPVWRALPKTGTLPSVMPSPLPPPPPDYLGGSLVNLLAELEYRLTGSAPSPRLHPHLGDVIPPADTYVLVLMDGLGSRQLDHPAAATLSRAQAAGIAAPFPTTTTVSLATIATGMAPRRHGVIGHMMYMPDHGVFNALKWIGLDGRPVPYPMERLLPDGNLWERLAAAQVEPITIQPGNFAGTPLTRALYRGCRFESVWSYEEVADATVDLASTPGRLIFVYLGDVDFAAHLFGQGGGEYAASLHRVTTVWESIALRLPDSATLVGTADHGHIDYRADQKVTIPSADLQGLAVYGDPRALLLRGDRAEAVAAGLPGSWLPRETAADYWGPGPEHPEFAARAPCGVLLADPGVVLLPGHMDRRLVGYHGGLAPEEVEVPILIA